jgi:hypothetical protein
VFPDPGDNQAASYAKWVVEYFPQSSTGQPVSASRSGADLDHALLGLIVVVHDPRDKLFTVKKADRLTLAKSG